MRELTYFVATSLDGFIAGEGGSLDGFPWDEAFIAHLVAHYPETLPTPLHQMLGTEVGSNRQFGTVLMGRKTYEVGTSEGLLDPYPTLETYVVSRTLDPAAHPDVTIVSDKVIERIRSLKGETGRPIWLCGGAELAATLVAAELVDSVVVKVNPVLFGTGIPLVAGLKAPLPLVLEDCTTFPSGHAILHDRIQH